MPPWLDCGRELDVAFARVTVIQGDTDFDA